MGGGGIHAPDRKFENDKYTAKSQVHPMEATNAYEGNGVGSIATVIINLNTRFAPRFYTGRNPE